MSIPGADPYISNPCATAVTGFPCFLEDIAAMDGLSFAAEQISLGAAQGDPLCQYFHNRIMQPCKLFYCQ